jgi:hypothetical protein
MNLEKYLEDVCLDLIVSKHVYNCSRIFKAADHILYIWCENMYIVQVWQYEKKQEWQKSLAWTRQTDGKNLVWFGEIERKIAKLSKATFTYRSSS